MGFVLGKNVILEFFENGQWYPYACARSASITTNTDMVDVTTTGAGRDRNQKPTINSWSGTMDGLTNLAQTGMMTLPDLRARQMSQTPMLLRYQRTDTAGNTYTDQGTIYFTSIQDVTSFDNADSFTISFVGTGSLTQVFTPTTQPTPLVYRYEYTGTGGETGFTADGTGGFPDLRNKNVIVGNKDGIGSSKIIGSTPASKEMQYVPSTGLFNWAIPFEPNEEAYVLYQNT